MGHSPHDCKNCLFCESVNKMSLKTGLKKEVVSLTGRRTVFWVYQPWASEPNSSFCVPVWIKLFWQADFYPPRQVPSNKVLQCWFVKKQKKQKKTSTKKHCNYFDRYHDLGMTHNFTHDWWCDWGWGSLPKNVSLHLNSLICRPLHLYSYTMLHL